MPLRWQSEPCARGREPAACLGASHSHHRASSFTCRVCLYQRWYYKPASWHVRTYSFTSGCFEISVLPRVFATSGPGRRNEPPNCCSSLATSDSQPTLPLSTSACEPPLFCPRSCLLLRCGERGGDGVDGVGDVRRSLIVERRPACMGLSNATPSISTPDACDCKSLVLIVGTLPHRARLAVPWPWPESCVSSCADD